MTLSSLADTGVAENIAELLQLLVVELRFGNCEQRKPGSAYQQQPGIFDEVHRRLPLASRRGIVIFPGKAIAPNLEVGWKRRSSVETKVLFCQDSTQEPQHPGDEAKHGHDEREVV